MPPKQKKHKETFNPSKLRTLYSASFIFSISLALIAYVESSFLETILAPTMVGLVFVVGYIITLVALGNFGHMVTRIGKRNTTIASFVLVFLSLTLLALQIHPLVSLGAFVLYLMSVTLASVSIDILVETYSSDGETGKIRGAQMTITNAGWVIAPVVSGFVLEHFGFSRLFALALIFLVPLILFLVYAFRRRVPADDDVVATPPFFSTLRMMLFHRALSHIFVLSFLLQFFYAWMVIYTPLYLVSLGISWSEIGKIFSVMLLPFVLFEYPAGVIADRWLGEKELLMFGFIVLSAATIGLYFIPGPVLWLWALLLFCTRVGASIIAVMCDAYFFKQVDERDVDLIGLYRNTYPLAYIVAPLVVSAILLAAPMHTLFFVLGCVMIIGGLFFTARLVDTK